MKRVLAAFLLVVLLLTGCTSHYRTDITREEIIAAYEAAGYTVSSKVYDQKLEYGQIAYVQADHPNGDYIYFSIFETEEEAQQNKREFYHPLMTGLFSVIYGKPSLERCKVYGCILVQYDQPEFLKVFEQLLKEK